MSSTPRHNEMHELTRELRAIEDRAVALSVYDYPEGMSMGDIIIFALTVYDTPERQATPEQLKEVFSKCGQFGVVAIDGVITDKHPYLHLGEFHDSVESLQRDGFVEIKDKMGLTRVGKQIGAALFSNIWVAGLTL